MGLQNGEADTRGTLFNDIIRILQVKKPKYLLLENVRGFLSAKFKPTLDKIIAMLQAIGYDVRYALLNS
jgi:DNA (cytosine-5)-methyltransferase 1